MAFRLVLKEVGAVLAKSKTKVFQSSLDISVVPEDWRLAYITPIPKAMVDPGERGYPRPHRVLLVPSLLFFSF